MEIPNLLSFPRYSTPLPPSTKLMMPTALRCRFRNGRRPVPIVHILPWGNTESATSRCMGSACDSIYAPAGLRLVMLSNAL